MQWISCTMYMYGLRCKNDKLRMHVSTNYWGLFMTSRFRYEGFKNNSFFTSSEVHLACSERLTFVLV